jgi:hypothetical protein
VGIEEKAGMLIDEKIVGIWYLSTIPNAQDWQAAVREIEPDNKYELVYRFRYYKDDKVFESEDRKSWYKGTITGTRSFVIANIRHVAKMLKDSTHTQEKVYEVINENDYQKMLREFMDWPHVYSRMEKLTKLEKL